MTRYKKIQERARALGIDTVQDNHGPRGWWIVKPDGSGVWEDDNWASTLNELDGLVDSYAREIEATQKDRTDDIRST